MVRSLAAVRAACPALRYGRQYFRPLSGDRQNFGISNFAPGILAFSRILNDEEVIYISNATEDTISIVVIVDGTLHGAGTVFRILYPNDGAPTAPGPVETISNVRVEEVDGSIGTGPVTVLPVTLAPGETQILGR